MRKTFRRTLIVGALWAALSLPLAATTIYDNSVNDQVTRFTPVPNLEFGDQIVLAGTERFVTNFSFEFFGANPLLGTSFAGPVSAKLRFYDQDGAIVSGQASPGTLLFTSGWVPLTITARSTLNFNTADLGGGFTVSGNELTWTVEISGLVGNDQAGVDIYGPPVIGNNYPDYWQKTVGGTWVLLTNTIAMDFASKLEASAVIPEPASLGLSLFGGLALLVLARKIRRQ